LPDAATIAVHSARRFDRSTVLDFPRARGSATKLSDVIVWQNLRHASIAIVTYSVDPVSRITAGLYSQRVLRIVFTGVCAVKSSQRWIVSLFLSGFLLTVPKVVLALDTIGAGSSFVAPLMTKWAADYAEHTGNHLVYNSIGSGEGIKQIKAGAVDFGATDKPLSPEELAQAGLGQFPIVVGGVVPVVSIPGIQPGDLKLTGAVLADIYLGKIKRWDDKAISALNPQLKLPALDIDPISRSDSSGTTFNFTNYLSKVSSNWRDDIGSGTTVSWPVGASGKGNVGVASYIQAISGTIGYVEFAYALEHKLAFVQMQNAAGKFVLPSTASFAAAAAQADWKNTRDFYLVMTNAPGETSWPIAATTFVLITKKPQSADRLREVLKFMKDSLEGGAKDARDLNFVMLPPALIEQVETYWKKEISY
jgi:phosphate transport system substrate-binding protein